MALTITHWQASNGRRWQDDTCYLGRDKDSGLHRFRTDGKLELYARRRSPTCGYQIIRGAHYYEFVRSE